MELDASLLEVTLRFLNDKLTRLAELNSLLDRDDKGEDAVDLDEDAPKPEPEKVAEEKAIYDAIPEEHRNMIPAVGMKLHYEERGYDDVQWDFMYGNRIDLGNLSFLPDISNNKEAIASQRFL